MAPGLSVISTVLRFIVSVFSFFLSPLGIFFCVCSFTFFKVLSQEFSAWPPRAHCAHTEQNLLLFGARNWEKLGTKFKYFANYIVFKLP